MTKKMIAVLLVVLLACFLMAFVVGGRAPTRPVQTAQPSGETHFLAPVAKEKEQPIIVPALLETMEPFAYPAMTEESYP